MRGTGWQSRSSHTTFSNNTSTGRSFNTFSGFLEGLTHSRILSFGKITGIRSWMKRRLSTGSRVRIVNTGILMPFISSILYSPAMKVNWCEPQKLNINWIRRPEGSGICVEQVSGPLRLWKSFSHTLGSSTRWCGANTENPSRRTMPAKQRIRICGFATMLGAAWPSASLHRILQSFLFPRTYWEMRGAVI